MEEGVFVQMGLIYMKENTRTGWRRQAPSLFTGENISPISLTCIHTVAFVRNRLLRQKVACACPSHCHRTHPISAKHLTMCLETKGTQAPNLKFCLVPRLSLNSQHLQYVWNRIFFLG